MNNQAGEHNKVLICDDDRTHLLIMRETLASLGYIVEEAANGELAVEAYYRFLPDIVLLDVNMPKLDGYSVCSIIRRTKTGENIPILMITGSEEHEAIDRAFEVGATDFLPKPIRWPLICHRIKYMLRSHELQKDIKKNEKELRFLAYYDTLTKLPNRQYFTEQLSTSIALSKRRKTTMAIMFIDLDHFKRINDTLGHRYGDLVLKEVASRLTMQLRASDVITRSNQNVEAHVARLGGDEFTLLLSDCGSSTEVMEIAKRILGEISKPIVIEQYSLVVTASIGISICPLDGDNAEDLLKFADMAMYEAKESGKNCYRLHSKELNKRLFNRLKLEEYMREALDTGMFELYYQPQVNTHEGTVNGAEALLRLHHPTLGVVSPTEFIPVAEDTGLIVDIGYWVILQACKQQVEWRNSVAANISISVNVSVKQINQPHFVSRLAEIIRTTGADPSLLEIELTESIIMNNAEENISKLNELKELGIKLSIDDFGTGYSSLSYLKLFPLDKLKIDRSFIIGLTEDTDNEDSAIVNAISAMAKALKLNVVVEGVETIEQLNCVSIICTDENMLIQGYFHSKPVPAKAFIEFMHKFMLT
jgi:diguanylate cyclase (GGDEF)-like protein